MTDMTTYVAELKCAVADAQRLQREAEERATSAESSLSAARAELAAQFEAAVKLGEAMATLRARNTELEASRDDDITKAKRSGYIAAVGALHNAMPDGFLELDNNKIIERVAARVAELERERDAWKRAAEANKKYLTAEQIDAMREEVLNYDFEAGESRKP